MGVADDVLALLLKRRNVVLHGPGGVGKSHTIHSIVTRSKILSEVSGGLASNRAVVNIVTVTPTGISAVNLTQSGTKARTIHSWAGVKSAQEDARTLAEKVAANRFARAAWMGTTHLIIDEISMLGKELWEKLSYVGKYVRNSPLPFGGITILACGDFFQLPPVRDDFVFCSEEWREIAWEWIELTVPKRYENLEWFEAQLRMRQAELLPKDWKMLEDRIRAYDELMASIEANPTAIIVKPTILHCTNISTESENLSELRKLTTKTYTYKAEVHHLPFPKKKISEAYVRAMFFERIPEVIELKVGAQVMLKANLDVENSLANGSRGAITEITEAGIHVLWATGADTWVVNYVWSHEDEDGISTCSQMPLVLAWSMTIHKSQSLTMDCVAVDLQGTFSPGQGYVGISRCRTYEGLYVLGMKPNSFEVNRQVKEYVDEVLSRSQKMPVFELDIEPMSRAVMPNVEGFVVTYYPRFSIEGEDEEALTYRIRQVAGYPAEVVLAAKADPHPRQSREAAEGRSTLVFLESGLVTFRRISSITRSHAKNEIEFQVSRGSALDIRPPTPSDWALVRSPEAIRWT